MRPTSTSSPASSRARFRDEDLADQWIKQSNRWIEDHKDRPFFLFFAAHDIHVPRAAHERFQGKTTMGPRGDSIVQLDWCVDELMKTLDRLGLAENTLVVFCSDNGPVLDDGYQDDAVEKLGKHQPAGHGKPTSEPVQLGEDPHAARAGVEDAQREEGEGAAGAAGGV